MKLFLTASTITPNLISPFEQMTGRPHIGLKTAFIPDAGYGSSGGPAAWIEGERAELARDLQWEVTEVPLVNETPVTIRKLLDYDVIYVNGGFSGYLANAMRQSGFDKLLLEIFARGIIYVGSSAGSMVMSGVQDAESWYIGEPEPEAINIPGMGYVDFQFYPLHKSLEYPGIIEDIKKKRNRALKYYIVPDGSAISIVDEEIETHGDVVFIDREG